MESSVLCDDSPFRTGNLIMPCAYSSHPYHIALLSIGNRHFVYGNEKELDGYREELAKKA